MRARLLTVALMTMACGGPSTTATSTTPTQAGPAEEPATYPVDFTMPVSVGDRWRAHLHARTAFERTVDTDSRDLRDLPEPRTEAVDAEMVAVFTVARASAEGRLEALWITVESLAVEGMPTPSAFRPGVEIEAVRGDPEPFRIEGEPVDEDTLLLLGWFFAVSAWAADRNYGRETPQPVGATWSPEPEALARHLSRAGSPAHPDDVFGEVTLLEAIETPQPALRVRVRESAANQPIPGIPDDSVEVNRLERELSFVLPLAGLRAPCAHEVESTRTVAVVAFGRTAVATIRSVDRLVTTSTCEPL